VKEVKVTMRQIRNLLGSVLLLALLLPACSSSSEGSTTTVGAAGLPNPASVYCGEQGGTLDIRADEEGNQYGFCVFEDGSECDEWAFYRGECAPGTEDAPMGGEAGLPNPASVYCEEQGGTVVTRADEEGNQYGFCVFEDGSECDEWAFFRGECSLGG
jgi:putative hemolysin